MNSVPSLYELIKQISEYEKIGSINKALNLSRYITQAFPLEVDSWLEAGKLLSRVNNHKMAIHCFSEASTLTPQDLYVKSILALEYARSGETNKALRLISSISLDGVRETQILSILGNACSICDEQTQAFQLFERAVSLENKNLEHKYNLANSYRFLGNNLESEKLFDEVLIDNPMDGDAILTRSRLRKQTNENNHIEWLLKQLKKADSDSELKTSIQYALAKEYEDLGESELSFFNLKEASARRRASMDYSVEADINSINFVIDTFSKPGASISESYCNNAEPIFIVGLPRSGTTLTERILDSHTKIKSAGELKNFSSQIKRLIRPPSYQSKYGSFMDLAHQIDPLLLGQSYIDSTRPRTGQVPHFIDKMPQNYMNIGLILRSLPKAKIIVLERNPMDTCYALFKAYFTSGVRFSYSLTDLGKYYLAYRKLMEFWNALYSKQLHIVSYEDLVLDTENQAKGIIKYCGLNWEEQCLQFYKNTSPSSTASTSQVRRPIYTSSLNRWMKYRPQLKILEDMFVTAGIDIGT